MPEVIKVKANAEGRYPIRLFGTEYEIEPVTDAREETATQNRKSKSLKNKVETPQTQNGEDAQPTSEANKPHNETTGADKASE